MNEAATVNAPATWTWADLISTYRFWVLLILYVVSSAIFLSFSALIPFLQAHYALSSSETRVIFDMRNYGGFFALYLAWIAARWKPAPILFLAGVLQLIGLLFLVVPSLTHSPTMHIVGAVSWGLGYYTLLLAIPAFLAGALGGIRSFVVAFGVIFTLSRLIQFFVPLLIINLINSMDMKIITLSMILAVLLLLATLLLLTINPALFHDPPPPRGRSLPTVHRDPVGVALLCLIPFYPLYWLYRSHGEVASLAPSRALLSPGGAVGVSFIPFMIPIMLTTLIDEMNGRAANLGIQRLRSPWAVFFWSMLVFPVGVALVQSAINQLMTRSETFKTASQAQGI
jgi:hypothetical protein